jgi:DnaJ-class molecular chaperone
LATKSFTGNKKGELIVENEKVKQSCRTCGGTGYAVETTPQLKDKYVLCSVCKGKGYILIDKPVPTPNDIIEQVIDEYLRKK